MNFRERWRIAGYVAQDIRFQSYLEANPTNFSRTKENPENIASQIKRASSLNVVTTAFIIIVLGLFIFIPFYSIESSGSSGLLFSLDVTLFLVISSFLILFMNITSSTGFFDADAIQFLSTLPFHKRDLEDLMQLSFLRTFIAPLASILVLVPLMMTLLFGPLTGIFVLAASVVSSILAIGLLVEVAGWFHKKSKSGDNSKLSVIIRIGAGLGFILGMFAGYSMVSFMPLISEAILRFSFLKDSGIFTLLALIYPISFGIVASVLLYGPIYPVTTIVASIIASLCYFILGARIFHKIGKTLRAVLSDSSSSSITQSPPTFDVISPLHALIRKDFSIATRSLGSIVVLVLPIVMFFSVIPILSIIPYETIRSTTVLLSLGYTTIFAGFSVNGILNLDTQGASVYDSLPLESRLVIRGKSAIFAPFYIATMIIVFVVLLGRPLISSFLLFIPLFQIPCVYSITYSVGTLIYMIRSGGHAISININGDQLLSVLGFLISAVLGILPLMGYTISLITTDSHLVSVVVQLSIVILEVLLVRAIMQHILKD